MSKEFIFSMLLAAGLTGCTEGALPTSSSIVDEGDAEDAAKDDGMCIRRSRSCSPWSGRRCCTGFCSVTGYGPGTCVAPLADGASCWEDRQCRSHSCVDYTCQSACRASGGSCTADGDCCSGLFCYNFTYAPWTCKPPQADGAFCTDNRQCQSGVCEDYQCVSQRCASTGSTCSSDGDCCAGSFCDPGVYSYTYHQCTPALAAGEYCLRASQCRSGSCVDYRCQ